MNDVVLRMKPVCSCGYVFDEMLVYLPYLDRPYGTFSPSHCPRCGGTITEIRLDTDKGEEPETMIFK